MRRLRQCCVACLVLAVACDPSAEPEAGPVDADGDGAYAEADCDDSDPDINPSATELCNLVDDDCDGEVDEGSAQDAAVWYRDSDGDGYGAPDEDIEACDAPSGHVADGTDCDDGNAAASPGADELCNGYDDNCDGWVDEATALDTTTWWLDDDGDRFGDPEQTTQACNMPANYADNHDDCDDTDNMVSPNAPEWCDEIDNDCDGNIDETDDAVDRANWYRDGDGFGDPDVRVQACSAPTAYVSDRSDCDDRDDEIHPDAVEICDDLDNDCDGDVDDDDDSLDLGTAETWYRDADGDGYGDAASWVQTCLAPTGYVAVDTDCDDDTRTTHPDAIELCDASDTDEDCDGLADDDDASASSSSMIWYYPDADEDGYGDEDDSGTLWCDDPSTAGSAWSTAHGDCDDGDASLSPAATEVCDDLDVDEDCDGAADDDDSAPSGRTETWPDADGDGFGDERVASTPFCDLPTGVSTDDSDCDDTDADVSPEGIEVCDGVDNDCDGSVDPDDAIDAQTWYLDSDGDGFGVADSTTVSCAMPTGYAELDTDCDDVDVDIHPAADEVCDDGDTDEDCNGLADDDDPDRLESTATLYYPDADADGWGDASSSGTLFCDDPSTVDAAWLTDDSDCDDADEGVRPDATELCDDEDVDEDCNGLADDEDPDPTGMVETWPDADGDSYGDETATAAWYCDPPFGVTESDGDCDDGDALVYPGATEYCTGTDDDCDGTVDDDCEVVCPVYVDPSLRTSGFGRESDPYARLATAIADRDSSCTEIILMDGTYSTNLDFGGEDLYIHSVSGSGYAIIQPSSGTGVTFDSAETEAATLEGVTVRGGSTGISISGASPTFIDVIVEDASLRGVSMTSASPSFEDCAIQDNGSSTSSGRGGGVSVYSSSPSFTDTVITGNTSGSGGGMYLSNSTPTFAGDCSVTRNRAEFGGGLYAAGTIDIAGLTIQSNVSETRGGGVYLEDTTGDFTDNQLINNTATYAGSVGGSMYVEGGSPHIEHNLIQGGWAYNLAGGVYMTYAAATFFNNLLVENNRHALYLHYDDSWVIHNTIVDSDHYGVTTFGSWPSTVFANNLVSGSGYYDVVYGGSGSWVYNLIADDSSEHCGTSGNVCGDPNLDSSYSPSWPSVAIDAGMDASAYSVGDDYDGNARDRGPAPDIGAFETYGPEYDCVTETGDMCGSTCPAFADPDVEPGGDGSESSPFPNPTYAIAYRPEGCDEVELLPGTYFDTVDFGGEDLHVYSTEGAETTIIDATGRGRTATFNSGETSAATLEGVTLTGGLSNYGGGLYIANSDPNIVDCIVEDNVAGLHGGGAYLTNFDGTISGTTFLNNATDYTSAHGGAVYVGGSSTATISGCTFDSNAAPYGAAIYVDGTSPTISRSWFEANTGGASLYLNAATALVDNNVFVDSVAIAIHLYTDASNIINNTIVDSVSTGLYGSGRSTSDIINNIFYGSGAYDVRFASGSTTWSYLTWENNNVYGGPTSFSGMDDPTGTNGNIAVDPVFDGSYGLSSSSSCVDAGQDSSSYGVSDDFFGTFRPVGAAYDIGAVESF